MSKQTKRNSQNLIDYIKMLTGTERPRKYWNDLKKKLVDGGYFEVSEKIVQLRMAAPDGKMRETDCANTETIFRIIQSIPSSKAEPFKRWLARVVARKDFELKSGKKVSTKRNYLSLTEQKKLL